MGTILNGSLVRAAVLDTEHAGKNALITFPRNSRVYMALAPRGLSDCSPEDVQDAQIAQSEALTYLTTTEHLITDLEQVAELAAAVSAIRDAALSIAGMVPSMKTDNRIDLCAGPYHVTIARRL